MPVERCPNCQGRILVPKKCFGLEVACPHCEGTFIVSDEDSAASAAPEKASVSAAAVREIPLPTALQKSKTPARESAPVGGSAAPAPPGKFASQPTSLSMAPPAPPAPASPASPSPTSSSPAASTPPESNVQRTPSAIQAPPAPPAAAAAKTSSPTSAPANPATAPAPPAPTTPVRQRPTARVIRKEQEFKRPDDQLPTLQLMDSPQRNSLEIPKWKSSPLVLGLLFCISMIASVGLLLVDFEAAPTQRKSSAEARRAIREFYEVRPGSPLEPYQSELRLAQQAHSRGDREAELNHYRNVMAYLRAEDRNPYTGLTGSKERDAELESYLSGLLSKSN